MITAVDCGDPGQLYNGYIDGRRQTYGSVIRYRCLDGTKFDGLAMSATCLETGQWSFPTPRCLSKWSKPFIKIHEWQGLLEIWHVE